MIIAIVGCAGSPFERAIRKGDAITVKSLLYEGVAVNVQDREGSTYLMEAAELGHVNVLNVLLDFKADPDLQDTTGKTALMKAAMNNHPGVVKILVERGADIKLKDKEYGYSALDFAVEIGHPEVVEILKNAKKE